MALDTFQLGGHSTSLSPAEIERELSSLWKPQTEGPTPDSTSVSRIVLGNVIWIGTANQADRTRAVILKVLPKYPCRLFLLEYQPDNNDAEVRATVNAQCFVPKKGEPPVCCEYIQMTFGPASAKHLNGCVTPLLLAELQTVLWQSLGDVELKQLQDIKGYADRTIHQASLSAKPSAMLKQMIASNRSEFDLSWFRMRPIREQVAAFFDDPAASFNLAKVSSVRINAFQRTEGSTLPELMGALFVGWLAARLKWQPIGGTEAAYHFKSPSGIIDVRIDKKPPTPDSGSLNLSTIQLASQAGETFEVAMESQDDGGVMDMRSGCGDKTNSERRLFLCEFSEADALGVALNTQTPTRYFREAATLAVPVLEHFSK